jgi:hypothetical protein
MVGPSLLDVGRKMMHRMQNLHAVHHLFAAINSDHRARSTGSQRAPMDARHLRAVAHSRDGGRARVTQNCSAAHSVSAANEC